MQTAATKDGLKPSAPKLMPEPKCDLLALTAAHRAYRHTVDIIQQKAVHAHVLDLM